MHILLPLVPPHPKLSAAALFQVWKAWPREGGRFSSSYLLKEELKSCVRGWHFTSCRSTLKKHRLKSPRLLVRRMLQQDKGPRGLDQMQARCSGKVAVLNSLSREDRERALWWESLQHLSTRSTQQLRGYAEGTDANTVQHWGCTTQVMSNYPEITKLKITS